jgi:4-amino-4-deoxy-L-arabinose transferase-like glycosyltransferase
MLSNIARSLRHQPAVWALAAAATVLHLAYAGRYDIFRNELYYIVCGRHPAFGYADQPPLVPLIAAATQVFGLSAWLLRLPGALAAGALVKLTADFAGLLGGGRAAAIIAAAASAMAPALVGMAQITTTATFEPLAWTAFAYFVTRAIVGPPQNHALLWAGLVAGLALEAKYGLFLWLAGIAIGVAVTPARRLLVTQRAGQGAFIGFAIAVPSLIWQAMHGWPFLAVMLHHTAGHTNFTGTPVRFEIGQALAMNAVLAPLWITGLVAPFATPRLKEARPLAIAYVVAAALIIVLRGKDYYLFPAYPTLFAIGAVAAGVLTNWLLTPWMLLAAANSAILLPIVLPILDPPRLAAVFERHPHLRPAPDELAGVGAPLTQVFSDELGWRALEQSVAAVYRKLPPEDQRRAAIVGSNYGEAAAIDVYGRADNLPPAISGQDQYYFWGPRGYDGSVVIHINGDPDRWRNFCASVEVAGTFGAPLVMPYENNRPIFICRGLKVPFTEAWEMFKRFQ